MITTTSTDWFDTTPWSYPDSWNYTHGYPDAVHGISPVLITENPQVIARTGTSRV